MTEEFRKHTIRSSIVIVASRRAEQRGCGCCGGGCCAPPINERTVLRAPRLEYTPLSCSTPAAATYQTTMNIRLPTRTLTFKISADEPLQPDKHSLRYVVRQSFRVRRMSLSIAGHHFIVCRCQLNSIQYFTFYSTR